MGILLKTAARMERNGNDMKWEKCSEPWGMHVKIKEKEMLMEGSETVHEKLHYPQ